MRPARPGHLCWSPGQRWQAQRPAGRSPVTVHGHLRLTGLCLESLGPTRRGCSPAAARRLQQDVVLQRPGHAVDDEPPVIAQGGEQPGVS